MNEEELQCECCGEFDNQSSENYIGINESGYCNGCEQGNCDCNMSNSEKENWEDYYSND